MPTMAVSASAISIALAILGLSSAASAHDNWISRQRFHDPQSQSWCCDETDCRPVDDKDVEVSHDGFRLNSQYFISRKRVLPSSDTKYWACFNEAGRGPHAREKNVRCFFAPMNM